MHLAWVSLYKQTLCLSALMHLFVSYRLLYHLHSTSGDLMVLLRTTGTPSDAVMHAVDSSGVFRGACSAAAGKHQPTSPTRSHRVDDHEPDQAARVPFQDIQACGDEIAVPVGLDPQQSRMHATHAGNRVDALVNCEQALFSYGSPRRAGLISSAVSWLRGVRPQGRMHEYHAQVSDSDDADQSVVSHDMCTPMHVVLWHMLGDCWHLLSDAISVTRFLPPGHMHEGHARYQTCTVTKQSAAGTHGTGVVVHSPRSQQLSQLMSQQNAESAVSHTAAKAVSEAGMHDQTFGHAAERRSVRIAVVLACFNQVSASTSIINYAPVVLKYVGVSTSELAIELAALVSCCKTVGIVLGMSIAATLPLAPNISNC